AGGGGGWGAACARRFAAEGARVALNAGHDRERLAAAAQEIEGSIACFADVSDPAAVDAMFSQVKQAFGGVEILVHNAAITRDSLLMMMRPEAWREVLAVALDGAFHCARAALRSMIGARHGRIVHVISPAAFLGKSGAANYAAAKGGLLALTKSLAAEAARYSITVNAVCPGFVDTELVAGMPQAEREE